MSRSLKPRKRLVVPCPFRSPIETGSKSVCFGRSWRHGMRRRGIDTVHGTGWSKQSSRRKDNTCCGKVSAMNVISRPLNVRSGPRWKLKTRLKTDLLSFGALSFSRMQLPFSQPCLATVLTVLGSCFNQFLTRKERSRGSKYMAASIWTKSQGSKHSMKCLTSIQP